MEREIKVSGTDVIYMPFRVDPVERRVDFSDALSVMRQVMGGLVLSQQPNLIGIQGVAGSGKTGLAQLLLSDGVKVRLINVDALARISGGAVDITAYLQDRQCTYIIDDFSLVSETSYAAIECHLEAGGTVIVMVQDRKDCVLDVPVKWLQLSRAGLSEV